MQPRTPELLKTLSAWLYGVGEICLWAEEPAAAIAAFDNAVALDQQVLESEGKTRPALLQAARSRIKLGQSYRDLVIWPPAPATWARPSSTASRRSRPARPRPTC